jgi:hypothetical protein
MKGAGVIERGILENETSKVAVSGNNVVGFFFLSEPAMIIKVYILIRTRACAVLPWTYTGRKLTCNRC